MMEYEVSSPQSHIVLLKATLKYLFYLQLRLPGSPT